MSRFVSLAGASIACAATAICAPAARADTHDLQEIRVEGADSASPSGPDRGTLTVPSLEETRREIERTPGAVEVIDAGDYKRSTPAVTIKDVLDYTPGVFVQPKWGEDSRLSIRGSGLSRNFHLRGVQLYMDGIPVSTADGYGDFQEIDPSAYRLVEVYKGANALRFGANSLGGAINFVTPSGRDSTASLAQGAVDVGSFGFVRTQASTSGVHGKVDWFLTGSAQRAEGFRDHSEGKAIRFSGNVGYQFSENLETRFYLTAADVDQNIPGAVTRSEALRHPKRAALGNVAGDNERNINVIRLANKTTLRLSDLTSVDVGAFAVDRHLRHPIFQWLDYKYVDYGAFARVVDEREIAGHANRFLAGVNLHNGTTDARQYDNIRDDGGNKGVLLSDADQTSRNLSVYAENTFFALPTVGLVTGGQFLFARRAQDGKLVAPTETQDFELFSPKFGLLWNIDPTWQAFANLSRSVEVPSYGENSFGGAALAKPQKAWTGEIGTRGRREDFTWDAAVYRAHIKDELFCSATPAFPGFCTVVNLDKTMHQGVELGFGAAILKGIFAKGDIKDGGGDKLWLNLAYTFSDFRFRAGQYDGKQLPGAPRHFVRTELLYKHPSGVYAGPNVEWVPRAYYVDSENSAKTKAYALLGAKVGYDAGGSFSAYVEGRNLANKKYISSVSVTNDARGGDFPLYEPGTGRAVYAGVKYRW